MTKRRFPSVPACGTMFVRRDLAVSGRAFWRGAKWRHERVRRMNVALELREEQERLRAEYEAHRAGECPCAGCEVVVVPALDLTYWDKVWLAAMRIAQPE
jgi:hypothetical protein